MAYSNDPQPNVYAHIPSPLPNIEFPKPYWINRLRDLIMIGCMDPDLAYVALALPAAGNMFWTVITPSTKQLVQETTGKSWICGARQTISGAQPGREIARSAAGRIIYETVKHLDIAAFYAFFLSTGAKGVLDYMTFLKKMTRICGQNQSPYRGRTPVGGWPSDVGGEATGPGFLNSDGVMVGPTLYIPRGYIGAMIAWCSFSNLEGSGGVRTEMRIRDGDTQVVYDEDFVDNMFNTQNYAVVQYFTTEGRVNRDTTINLRVEFLESVTARAVPVTGGCFIKAWQPGTAGAPPYYNMRENIKSHPWKGPIG
jgi:hypothetical protein